MNDIKLFANELVKARGWRTSLRPGSQGGTPFSLTSSILAPMMLCSRCLLLVCSCAHVSPLRALVWSSRCVLKAAVLAMQLSTVNSQPSAPHALTMRSLWNSQQSVPQQSVPHVLTMRSLCVPEESVSCVFLRKELMRCFSAVVLLMRWVGSGQGWDTRIGSLTPILQDARSYDAGVTCLQVSLWVCLCLILRSVSVVCVCLPCVSVSPLHAYLVSPLHALGVSLDACIRLHPSRHAGGGKGFVAPRGDRGQGMGPRATGLGSGLSKAGMA